jgi:L-cysteine:1D-myo-inositol 2-amino-2-deoxy-alpha-D-glucopyranoside ligase
MSYEIDVTLVRNVTDLDDPLFERVRQSGESLEDLVQRNVSQLDEDLKMLNCIAPTYEPYSSQYIPQMILAISKLLGSGDAYTIDGWTYFDTAKRKLFPEFDRLRKLSPELLLEIASERGADPNDPRAKNPLDFVLWKPSASDEPTFDTPFGNGRPGWHIECSVMALELLGDTIDIHGGGDDLLFPHHACEVAQSETLTGKLFVHHFMHVAPVAYEGEKMSKSLGNLVYADTIIREIGEMCTRMMLLAHHYREGYEHHDSDAQSAQSRCARWSEALVQFSGEPVLGKLYESVCQALRKDLDTPLALELIDSAVEEAISTGDQSLKADISAAKQLLGFK